MHRLLDELQSRGLLSDCTDLAGLDDRLRQGPLRVYVGFDPTAPSLHVGSLMPLFVARLVRAHGHVPVLLVGGATGMIGDPTGRSDERNFLTEPELDANRAGLREQMCRLVGTDDPVGVEVVDNRSWLGPIGLLEFLRDVGCHFRVGDMLARDSVRSRLDAESGLSFTELSYQLLQAFDFWWLHENAVVEAQMGGSDQWGNITAGVEFMRKRSGARGFGLVWPLLTKADGSKFGKSQSGNVWLDADRTRPFDFWQFWFNTDDDDVETMLLQFSPRSVVAIEQLMVEHRTDPGARSAQRALAEDVTSWVHGAQAAAEVERAAALLFSPEPLSEADARAVASQAGSIDRHRDDLLGVPVIELAVDAGLCSSLGDARRVAAGGGIRLGRRVVSVDDRIEPRDLDPGGATRLARGRRSVALIRAL